MIMETKKSFSVCNTPYLEVCTLLSRLEWEYPNLPGSDGNGGVPIDPCHRNFGTLESVGEQVVCSAVPIDVYDAIITVRAIIESKGYWDILKSDTNNVIGKSLNRTGTATSCKQEN